MNNERIPANMFLDPSKRVIRFNGKATEVKYTDRWRQLFPPPPKGDYKKYRMTDVGLYSISKPKITDNMICMLTDLIGKYMNKPMNELTITETNGGIGGWTPALMDVFGHVNVVEIFPLHAEIIRHNISVISQMQNFKVINADYMDVMYDLDQDIIISDPPWGGPGYRKKKYNQLGFNNVNIVHVINRLYAERRFKMYVLLAMINFDIQDFLDKLTSQRVYIYRMDKHYFVVVFGQDIS